jgi:uncharacterized membrane-anchored protein
MAIREPDVAQVVGRCRVDRRTKTLVQRLLPGEIAVIDHVDLDRIAAENLIEAGAAAVVNASPSMSGRYPNVGPLLIAAAGIPLLDDVGSHVLDVLVEGEVVTVSGDKLLVAGAVVGHGVQQTMASLEFQIEEARQTVGVELERFANNTLEYLKRERHLVTDATVPPDIPVKIRGRQVLVVARGDDYRHDLQALKRSGYLKDVKPVLIGVDGGADALLDMGLTPDVIIGDFDSVRADTIGCSAALVVHAYAGGGAPGAARLEALGRDYNVFEAPGTSEDVALLLAYELGAELIVAVGLHNSMEEFLDKGRGGMASTFLVRLKVGRILVDAKGVNRIYRPVVRTFEVGVLIAAMLVALVAVAIVNRPLQLWVRSLWLLVRSAIGR